MKSRQLTVILTSIALLGCSAVPKVSYIKIEKAAGEIDANKAASFSDVTDSYFLNASVISISPPATGSDSKKPSVEYSIVAEPVEFLDFKVGIVPKNNFLSTTKLNITKAENSDRFASGGVETTDNLKTLISTIGGIGVQIAGLNVGAAPSGATTPSCTKAITKAMTIPMNILSRSTTEPFAFRGDPADSASECVEISVGPVPPDSIPISEYPFNQETSKYYYAACRNAVVTVKHPTNGATTKTVRIADPRYLQSVNYPYKGSITMHTQCGVSVKTDGQADPFSGLASASELLKQMNAIKDAK